MGRPAVRQRMALELVVAGLGLLVVAAAFLRLGVSDQTEVLHVVALEYGFALALLLAGSGMILLAVLLSVA